MTTEIFITNSPKKNQKIINYLCIQPYFLPQRIILSLIPPFLGQKYQKIPIDLLGPFLAVFSLLLLLQYGHNTKSPWAMSKYSPNDMLLGYVISVPLATFVLCKMAKSTVSFIEIVSILGYSLYGHILTLGTSLILSNEESNLVFFSCLLIFGGLSTLRIVVIFVKFIPKPAVRLVVCSFVSIVQLLYLIFLHFIYMHKNFVYGSKHRF